MARSYCIHRYRELLTIGILISRSHACAWHNVYANWVYEWNAYLSIIDGT